VATKSWIYFHPFSFSLKGGLGSVGVLSLASEIIFMQSSILVSISFLKRQIMISLSGGKKEGE
jgi:hypothetical protein